MKPENIVPQFSPEQSPIQPQQKGEILSGQQSVEVGIDPGAEKFEQRSEANAIMSDLSLMTALPTPVVTTSNVVSTSTTIGSGPATAKDDDLIEKEWVDKAKKIVSETQNDPHLREKAVSELQVDYIKKRFGRELGVAE